MNDNYMISNYINFNCCSYAKGPRLIHVSSQHNDLSDDLQMANPIRLHSHKFTEIILITQGSASFVYNTKTYSVNKGDMLIIPPGIEHLETWNSEFTFYTIGILDFYVIDDNDKNPIHATGANFDTFRFYFHVIVEETRNKPHNYKKTVKNIFANIIILLERDINTISKQQSTQNTNKSKQSAALIAKDFIEANYSQAINLKLLSQLSYVSPQHLIRQFKALMGCSPHQYLMMVRIQVAAGNLIERDNSIRQISEEVGFNEGHSFIYTFKKLIGITPTEYREKYQLSPAEGLKLARFMTFKNEKYHVNSFIQSDNEKTT